LSAADTTYIIVLGKNDFRFCTQFFLFEKLKKKKIVNFAITAVPAAAVAVVIILGLVKCLIYEEQSIVELKVITA